MEELLSCPQCAKQLNQPKNRLVRDTCGHEKCRLCLLNDDENCKQCDDSNRAVTVEVVNENIAINNEQNELSNVQGHKTLQLPNYVVQDKNGGFTCNICKKRFLTRSQIKFHSYCDGAKKPYQCTDCDKAFILKSRLNRHLLVHQNKQPYGCEKCKKRFSEHSKLQRHKLIHSTQKAFECDQCGKQFKCRENLRTHLLIHKPEKPYACNQCHARFSHASNLKKHKMTHSGEKAYMCDQCGKKFSMKSALKTHRKHHSKVRPNTCGTCSKTFIHLKDLQRHELIHLDMKGFTCGICGTSFKRKDNLNRHSNNSHPGEEVVVIRNKVKKDRPKTRQNYVDNPNAINVITAPPSYFKPLEPPKRETSFVNAPLKLAFKTSAFKNHYNIHRDYVEPVPPTHISIYEKILNPGSPVVGKCPAHMPPATEEESAAICQKILAPFNAPSHYETSFDNKKHAVIKNIKFKLPAEYTKLRCNEKVSDPNHECVNVDKTNGKTYMELKAATASVIVNTAESNDLHWRRRTAQCLASKET